MIHYNYSARQLESEAEKLLFRFDPERLKKPKSIDVYAVIEKCLGVEYDWKYITPDQSILGATAFNAGYIWVWPEPCYREGMLPSKAYLPKGCILIDATLTESGNRGRENFTVMHEVFHQVLHKNCFFNFMFCRTALFADTDSFNDSHFCCSFPVALLVFNFIGFYPPILTISLISVISSRCSKQ